MSNADWYAQRLAAARQPAPPVAQPPHYPPTAPPLAPGQLPPHLAPYAPQQPQQPPAQMPGASPQQQPQEYYSYDANTGAQVADDGTVRALAMAAQAGGSSVVRQNTSQCPNCFKETFFEVQEGGVFSKAAGGIVHAKQCASCGFPKVQAGSTGGSLATARSAGPAKQARQLPSNHRVTVAVEGGGYATFDPPTGA